MKEKHTRSTNIQSRETSPAPIQIGQIGNIFVTAEYENGDVCLILENRGEKAKSVTISYEESHKPGEESLEHFERLRDSQRKVPLPKEFEEWGKLYVRVQDEKKQISIPNTFLKKFSDEAKLQVKADPPQPKTEPSISKSEQTDNSINVIGKDLKPDIETTNVPEQRSIDYQHEAEITVQETREENRSIPNTSLKQFSDEAKLQVKADRPQPKTESSITRSEQTDNSTNIIGKDLKPDIEMTNVPEQRAIDYQHEIEIIIQEAHAKVETLAQAYENGEPIDIIEIDNPTPSQKVLMILNWIARTIEDWANELEQSGTANPDLIQTLGFANQDIKDKLKEVRGPAPPLPEPLKPDTDVSTDAEYKEFKNKCTAYVSHSEGLLVDYQLGRQIAETEYNQFLPQFIKDRLFNGVARFLSFEEFPEHLDQYLQLVGYEVVPIEIGETKADACLHDIQASRQTGVAPGTIVEVISPGLRRKVDGEIIQKPVVIRGE